MKKILFGLLVLISFQSFGQNPPGYQSRTVRERIQGSMMIDSALHIPRYCGTPSGVRVGSSIQDGALAMDTCNSILYIYSSGVWAAAGSNNTNLGSFYRLLVPSSQGIKGIAPGYGTLWDSTTNANSLTSKFDSATVFPQIRATIPSLSTLDTLINPRWDVVQNASGTSYKSHRRTVFNVKDFGATGDGVTDDTGPIRRAIDSVLSIGYGVVFLPRGTYLVDELVVPTVDDATWATLVIEGEAPPLTLWGTVGSITQPTNGSILKTTSTTDPVIIASASGNPSGFSHIHIMLKNLEFRTYDNPQVAGVDMAAAYQFSADNIFINTGVYNVLASLPTDNTAIGLITPAINNGAFTYLTNVTVTGYYSGIVVNEHTYGDYIVVASNLNGLDFRTAHQASRFDRVGAYRNRNQIVVSGVHYFNIDELNMEYPDSASQTTPTTSWQNRVYDFYDPSNNARANIYWSNILGGTGQVNSFIKEGGTNTQTTRIGTAFLAGTYTGDQFNTGTTLLNIGDINNSGAGVTLVTATNSNASGKAQFNLVGQSTSLSFGVFNSSFPVASVQNAASFGSTANLIVASSAGVASGGSSIISMRPTGYDAAAEIARFTGSGLELYGKALMSDISAPSTPASGYGAAYVRADSLRFKNDAGTEFTLGAGSGFTNLTSFVSQNNWKTFYSNGSGDVTELSIGAAGTYLKSAGTSSAPAWVRPTKPIGWAIESPTSSEAYGYWQTPVDITVSSIKAVVVGSSPSVTVNIAFGSDITSPTNVFSSGTAITNTTTGQSISTGFNDATIPAGSWIWVITTAQSGTVSQVAITLNYTED